MQTQGKGFYSKKGIGAVFDGVYLVAGKRTPFGKYTGSLSTVSPTDLGILSSRAVLSASGVPAQDIDQTIVANIGQASADSFFLPRHISLYSGAPLEIPALMVQRICGSGIEVIGQVGCKRHVRTNLLAMFGLLFLVLRHHLLQFLLAELSVTRA